MKIYLINNENEAKQIGQLLKLNAECAKLHWSKTMPDIPANVISSLEIIESFAEEKVYSICNENTCVGSLTEDEESEMMALLRESPELRATLGIGVVMAGAESQKAAALLAGKDISKELLIAINSGKNVVLF